MLEKSSILFAVYIILASCLLGCQNTDHKIEVDEKEIQGFNTKTFFNAKGNIEVTLASDGKARIVAVPNTAINRQKPMSDEEYKCLRKCIDIEDIQKRTNCTLLCPVTKQYQIFIY